jgi:hypothetical protein
MTGDWSCSQTPPKESQGDLRGQGQKGVFRPEVPACTAREGLPWRAHDQTRSRGDRRTTRTCWNTANRTKVRIEISNELREREGVQARQYVGRVLGARASAFNELRGAIIRVRLELSTRRCACKREGRGAYPLFAFVKQGLVGQRQLLSLVLGQSLELSRNGHLVGR